MSSSKPFTHEKHVGAPVVVGYYYLHKEKGRIYLKFETDEKNLVDASFFTDSEYVGNFTTTIKKNVSYIFSFL